jgi:hypothetical protein
MSGSSLCRFQGELDGNPGSGAGVSFQSAAQGFNPLAHTTQAMALNLKASASIIFDFDPAVPIHRSQAEMASVGSSMADHVGDGFAHH